MENQIIFNQDGNERDKAGRQGRKWIVALLAITMQGAACAPKQTTFSLLSQEQSFQQVTESKVMSKIDILWVIDNSGSMDPLQQNLVANFGAFIQNFQQKGFDFQIAVTTSDAYLASPTFNNNPALAKFRDGVGSKHSGYFILTPSTPNLAQNFVINATQNSSGSGDERAFQSLLTSLSSPLNSGFPRPDAFLAVIILSDEDDFSDLTRPEISWLRGGISDHNYNAPNLMTIDHVVAQLDQITGSTPANRRYNVSAITVLDSACRQQHAKDMPTTLIGKRYIQLANQTNGMLGSICDTSYASALNFIQQHITELSTQFRLTGDPNPATIRVLVDYKLISQDASNGWTFDSSTNVITFHGNAVPSANSVINITFDPLHLL